MNQSTEKEISFSEGQIIWNYIFLSVLFLLIILNNGLILAAVLSQRRLQSQINVIVLGSLALAQLLGGLLSIPINIALVQDYQADTRLKFARVVTTFCGVASQLHLTVLCIDRCIALLDSVTYGNLKRGSVVIAVLITWFVSIVASLLSIVDFKNYSVFIVTVFFVLPLFIDVFGYGLVYRFSRRENQTTLLRKELRLAKWFAILTLVFSVFWLPYVITILLRDHCGSCDTPSSVLLFVLYCQLLSLTFSSLVYYRGSLDFRLAFKIIAKELRSLVRGNNEPEEDISQRTSVHDGRTSAHDGRTRTSRHDGVVNQVNTAMFLDREDGEDVRKKGSTVRHSLSHGQMNNGSSISENEEVHIVPFDQARFFGQNEQKDELRSEKEASEISPFDVRNVEQASKEPELAFHDIEIIPYEQSC